MIMFIMCLIKSMHRKMQVENPNLRDLILLNWGRGSRLSKEEVASLIAQCYRAKEIGEIIVWYE